MLIVQWQFVFFLNVEDFKEAEYKPKNYLTAGTSGMDTDYEVGRRRTQPDRFSPETSKKKIAKS